MSIREATVLELPVITAGGKPGNLMALVVVPDSLQVTQAAKPPEGHGMFRFLSPKSGDDRVVWNRFSLTEIQDARQMFNDLVDKGLVPYRVGTDGRATSEVMDQFDPQAEEVIFLPVAMVAGG